MHRTAALALALLGGAVAAQDAPVDTTDLPPKTEPYEVAVLRSIYHVENPAFTATMRVTNASSYPIYIAAIPAAWAGTLLTDSDTRPALALTVSQAGNFGLTFALKNLIRRPRPYVALDDVDARDRRHQGDKIFDPNSFPSGHTSTAFVIATSLSLSYPEWYVVVPAAAWAGSMGLTRVWHGVHYPSDVLVGAAIGTTAAVATHLLLPVVVPDGGEDAEAAVVPVRLVIPL